MGIFLKLPVVKSTSGSKTEPSNWTGVRSEKFPTITITNN